MENTKKVVIQDMDNKLYFKIKLFDPLSGLDFLDRFVELFEKGKKESIKPFLGDLLKLASFMGSDGKEVQIPEMSIEHANSIMQNPLAVLDLGLEVMNFQRVFIEKSPRFQPFLAKIDALITTMNLV